MPGPDWLRGQTELRVHWRVRRQPSFPEPSTPRLELNLNHRRREYFILESFSKDEGGKKEDLRFWGKFLKRTERLNK